jgi:hypothetical protein
MQIMNGTAIVNDFRLYREIIERIKSKLYQDIPLVCGIFHTASVRMISNNRLYIQSAGIEKILNATINRYLVYISESNMNDCELGESFYVSLFKIKNINNGMVECTYEKDVKIT